MKTDNGEQKHLVLGRINGLYGVQGWLKVYSFSRPRENIFTYNPWLLKQSSGGWLTKEVLDWKTRGKGLIVCFDGIQDRTRAEALVGMEVAVARDVLPLLPQGEFYWCDLIGLEVVNQSGERLGRIVEILETGANDVLVVEGKNRHLIPLLHESVIKQVDQAHGRIQVGWNGEYI